MNGTQFVRNNVEEQSGRWGGNSRERKAKKYEHS